jgi:hypothetical protein
MLRDMTARYLEVTYRDGTPIAAYLYLPRDSGDKSVRTERREGGLIVDFAEGNRPIGIEITAPDAVSLEAVNRALVALDQEPATEQELAPLAAA